MTDKERAIKYRKEARRYKRKYGELILSIERIRADIGMYYADCSLTTKDANCRRCNDTVFNSVLHIIDRHMEVNNGKTI